MSSGKEFINTLKRIRFPKVDKFKAEMFDHMFEEKELLPFLECFCSLTEENLLTAEELEAYAALNSSDLIKIEAFNIDEALENESESEREESEFLQSHLALLEDNIKSLERNKEIIKQHEQELYNEKFSCEENIVNTQRKIQHLKQEAFPAIEAEFVSTLKNLSDVVEELETLIKNPDGKNIPSQPLFQSDVEHYLETEKSINDHIKLYLESNFDQFKEKIVDINSEEQGPSLSDIREEQLKEMLFLQKVLKISEVNKVISEAEVKKKVETLKFYESLKDEKIKTFDLQPSQLRIKLIEAKDSLQKLENKEQMLKSDVTKVIHQHVDNMCDQVANAAREENMQFYEYYNHKLQGPLDALIEQRARLELLIAYIDMHDQQLHQIKDHLQNVTEELEKEKSNFTQQKEFFEDRPSPKEKLFLSADSILMSLYKILLSNEELEKTDLTRVTVHDVLKKAELLHQNKCDALKQKELLSKAQEKSIEKLREKFNNLYKMLQCTSKEFPDWKEMERELNFELNKADVKLSEQQEIYLKYKKEFDSKKKMIEKDENLALSRRLFVYALTNEELFQECIKKIKIAIENANENREWRRQNNL